MLVRVFSFGDIGLSTKGSSETGYKGLEFRRYSASQKTNLELIQNKPTVDDDRLIVSSKLAFL